MASESVQQLGEVRSRLTLLLDQLESCRGDPLAGRRLLKAATDFQQLATTLVTSETHVTAFDADATIE